MDSLDLDLDPDWHSLGGGALIAAVLTLVRIGLDFFARHGERRLEREDRRGAHQRDAEARLERVLQDRLCEADRRLERCELEMDGERERRVAIEREYAVLVRAYELLKEQYSVLHAEQVVLLEQRQAHAEQQSPSAHVRAP
jgi:hypothetical protein